MGFRNFKYLSIPLLGTLTLSQFAYGAECRPSLPDIDSLLKIRTLEPLWKSYPYREMRFIMMSPEKDGTYFLGFSKEERSNFGFQFESCIDISEVVFSKSLSLRDDQRLRSQMNEALFEFGSAQSLVSIHPSLAKVTTKPIAIIHQNIPNSFIEGMRQAARQKATEADFKKYEILMRRDIFGPLLFIHEIFHDYQEKHFKEPRWRKDGDVFDLSHCADETALKEEAHQLQQLLPNIFQLSLEDLATQMDQLITRRSEGNPKCWNYLRGGERDEGSARYFETEAARHSGLLSGKSWMLSLEYALEERGRIVGDFSYWYSSGAIIGMVLDRLDPSKQWQKDIEDGDSFDMAASKAVAKFRAILKAKEIVDPKPLTCGEPVQQE